MQLLPAHMGDSLLVQDQLSALRQPQLIGSSVDRHDDMRIPFGQFLIPVTASLQEQTVLILWGVGSRGTVQRIRHLDVFSPITVLPAPEINETDSH